MKETSSPHRLWNISPLDGRYRDKLSGLENYASEAALICYRLRVEASWLLYLIEHEPFASDIGPVSSAVLKFLNKMATDPDHQYCQAVKDIEQQTNHDVKAVEYLLQQELGRLGAQANLISMVHFGCTSEDINNLSYGLMLRDLQARFLGPLYQQLTTKMVHLAKENRDAIMLARTHGQLASPTSMGKEMLVFAHRLQRQLDKFLTLPIPGKLNGAVGNFNAHLVAYPQVDWQNVSRHFIEDKLHLQSNLITTQIEDHDGLIEYLQIIKRIHGICLDLSRDIWGYIALGYFVQSMKKNEVGSSTMPHKVNPIDFENAEGNLGLSSALISHMSDKLPISRWQRDLSDSTVLRNLGVIFGHSALAVRSLLTGLDKISVNHGRIAEDRSNAWQILGEAVQTVMRRYGVVDAYDRLKAQTRGKEITHQDLLAIIDACAEIPDPIKGQLRRLTPDQYIGIASDLVEQYGKTHAITSIKQEQIKSK